MNVVVFLYIAVILLATLFAKLAMSVKITMGTHTLSIKKGTSHELCMFFVILSFLTLLLFTGLSTSGTDYTSYERWFNQSTSYSWSEIFSMEWAYYIFNRIVRLFTSDFHVFNMIYSIATLLLIYSTICYLSDRINFAWAVFIFGAVFYLPMFNLKRICLAAAVIFFGVRFLLQKKYILYLITFIIAIGIHTSAIFWVLFFVGYLLINERVYKRHIGIVIAICVLLIVLLLLTADFWVALASDISSRYSEYTAESNSLGLGLIIEYGVIIFLLLRWIYVFNRTNSEILQEANNSNIWRISVVAICVSTIFAFAGYINQVFSRMQNYALYSYVIFIPYLIHLWDKRGSYSDKLQIEILISKIVLVLYILFLFVEFASTQMITSGLTTYTTIWGLSIG